MTTKTKRNNALRPSRTEVRATESEYTAGYWSKVVADLQFTFPARITHVDERSANAIGHRLIADLLETSPADEHWCLSTEVTGSYRDIVQVRIAIELTNGDDDEMARAKAVLTEMTARL